MSSHVTPPCGLKSYESLGGLHCNALPSLVKLLDAHGLLFAIHVKWTATERIFAVTICVVLFTKGGTNHANYHAAFIEL